MIGESLTFSCVNDCATGNNGKVCSDYKFCSSTCATCAEKNSINACTSCPVSKFMKYETFPNGVAKGYCNLTAKNNVKYYLTVNNNTVTVDGKKLSDLYFKRNVIEFSVK